MIDIDVSRISRLVKEYEESLQPEIKPKYPYIPALELDDDEMEIFWAYWPILKKIGVILDDERLGLALSGHPRNIESAILSLIQYRHRLNDAYHPNNVLIKAIKKGWHP